MPEVVYYAAMSLDGYIATPDGGVEWLTPFQAAGDDHGFADFYSTVDSLVMGSHTYEFALRNPPWLAPEKPSWIFTDRDLDVADASVSLTSQEPPEVVELMRARGLNRVWLLGGGIPLLARGSRQDGLCLIQTKPYPSGIVQLCYEPIVDA